MCCIIESELLAVLKYVMGDSHRQGGILSADKKMRDTVDFDLFGCPQEKSSTV